MALCGTEVTSANAHFSTKVRAGCSPSSALLGICPTQYTTEILYFSLVVPPDTEEGRSPLACLSHSLQSEVTSILSLQQAPGHKVPYPRKCTRLHLHSLTWSGYGVSLQRHPVSLHTAGAAYRLGQTKRLIHRPKEPFSRQSRGHESHVPAVVSSLHALGLHLLSLPLLPVRSGLGFHPQAASHNRTGITSP